MRTLTLFALSVVGVALLSSDAQAFGKRRGGNGCGGGGGCYGGYGGYGGCSGGGYVSHGYGGGYGGCSGGGYVSQGYGGGYSGYGGVHGAYAPSDSGSGIAATFSGSSTTGGSPTVVRGTDGVTYTLGSDGFYYSGSSGITSGVVNYPSTATSAWPGPYPYTYSTYPGTYTYPGMWRGSTSYYPSSGIYYPAGYTAPYYGTYGSGVVPAGGALTMPGVNIGPGGINIVPGLMPRR